MTGLAGIDTGLDLLRAAPAPDHGLGPVLDDWEAAEVWLAALARRNPGGSSQTVVTYRFHLAKLRWYCERVARITPSRWTMREVGAFAAFLEDLPFDALCAMDGKRNVAPGEDGYTPFRKRPAPSSQSDIRRFVHAMFKAWHGMGYVRINPMALDGAGARRKINAGRALLPDLYELVLATMAEQAVDTFTERQMAVRDRFIFMALRGLGLRASELVHARMNAFYQLPDPATKKRYWVFLVSGENAKGGKERRVPVTRELLAVLAVYRSAFGLAAQPALNETAALLLSPRTKAVAIAGRAVGQAADRRYFGAWREVATRQGLYQIVKARIAQAANKLRDEGRIEEAASLATASPHWLRHTFAKAALLSGQSMREVAGLLGHASVDTTMIYTDQDALDLIRALERESPGAVAEEAG
ncbi:integrase/recombinase XerC [Oxalobacteraceae bacterium GrIS 1.11]